MDQDSYLYLFFEPVRAHLDDNTVSEILINGPTQIYVERRGRLERSSAAFASEHALKAAAVNVARNVGRLLDDANPRLDARLPDGSRVHAVLPPISRSGTVVAIRKFSKERLTLKQLLEYGSISEAGAELLSTIVKARRNVIVSGATSSGKTSVLNMLSGLIPGDQRILVLEDASELQLQQPHTVCFETRKPDKDGRGELTIRDLLHSALRLRPDRLVVGEIRGAEAIDLLQALNTGHDGSMSTIHANSSLDCLFRLETCCLLSGVDIPLAALRTQIASAVHVIVHTARLSDGSRKITHITEVLGLREGSYELSHLLVYHAEGGTPEGGITGRHVATGTVPRFLQDGHL
jgi:pilus assembly protein CpaF